MNWRKYIILATFVAMLFTVVAASGQAKSQTTKPERASVLLRFAKDGTLSASCSQTIGLITQSMLQLDGVKNVKIDTKSNGVQVSYDRGQRLRRRLLLPSTKKTQTRSCSWRTQNRASKLFVVLSRASSTRGFLTRISNGYEYGHPNGDAMRSFNPGQRVWYPQSDLSARLDAVSRLWTRKILRDAP
jgi:hypothetical protein